VGIAQRILRHEIRPSAPGRDHQYTEKWAEVARADVHDVEAWRMRIAWEERGNPNYPGAVFPIEVTQVLMLHPQDPDKIISMGRGGHKL